MTRQYKKKGPSKDSLAAVCNHDKLKTDTFLHEQRVVSKIEFVKSGSSQTKHLNHFEVRCFILIINIKHPTAAVNKILKFYNNPLTFLRVISQNISPPPFSNAIQWESLALLGLALTNWLSQSATSFSYSM